MLYTLAQLGFKIDILKYGMNVILDVINLSVELSEQASKGGGDIPEYDLAAPIDMEG